MFAKSLWRRLFAGRPTPRAAAPTFRPSVESLEHRLVPAAAKISGHVFQDLTGNGLSADDTALAGVVVKLYRDTNNNGKLDAADHLAGRDVTGANGAYSFGNLTAGRYFVKEVVPHSFVRTAPALGTYYTVNVAAGQSVVGGDFDNFRKLNRDAIRDVHFTITHAEGTHTTVTDLRGHTHAGDTVTVNFTVAKGAGQVTVSLVSYNAPGASFDPHTAAQQTIATDATGKFGPGAHSLSVTLPSGFYQVDFVLGAAIDHFGPAGSNIFYSAQHRLLSADNGGAAVVASSSLSGTVVDDFGVGLANVTLTLTGINDLNQQVTMTTTTGPNGSYNFKGLRAGTFTITQTPLSDHTDASSTAGNLGGAGTADAISGIKVGSGGTGTGYNFVEVFSAPPPAV
jgi:hypothetical protein